MKINFYHLLSDGDIYDYSCGIHYEKDMQIDLASHFQSKNKFIPKYVYINLDESHWKCSLAHELGHLLSIPKRILSNTNPYEIMRREILAWRLAKSFIKPKYWNEQHAIDCLADYIESLKLKNINIKKLKIIPLYRI